MGRTRGSYKTPTVTRASCMADKNNIHYQIGVGQHYLQGFSTGHGGVIILVTVHHDHAWYLEDHRKLKKYAQGYVHLRPKGSNTALTNNIKIQKNSNNLPNTFLPGRNLLFLVLAGSLAYNRNINSLSGGMCETDFSGYPDCRRDTIDSQEKALSLGLDMDIKIYTPLMNLDKNSIWSFANEYGGKKFIDIIINNTHTCYLGVRENKNVWGYGCAECPACLLRSNGFFKWKKSITK